MNKYCQMKSSKRAEVATRQQRYVPLFPVPISPRFRTMYNSILHQWFFHFVMAFRPADVFHRSIKRAGFVMDASQEWAAGSSEWRGSPPSTAMGSLSTDRTRVFVQDTPREHDYQITPTPARTGSAWIRTETKTLRRGSIMSFSASLPTGSGPPREAVEVSADLGFLGSLGIL